MKGRELVAQMRALKEGVGNARAWLDDVERKADEVIAAFTPTEAQPPEPTSDFVVGESEGREEWVPPSRSGKVQFKGDPLSKSVADGITPKQLGMIRALAREAGVDYEAECMAQLDCKPEDLSKRAASAFIDYLKVINEQGVEFRPVSQ